MRTGLLGAVALLVCALGAGSPPCASPVAIRADIAERIASGDWFVRFRSNDHGSNRALRALYETTGDAPLWVLDAQPTPQALALLRVLGSAEAFGLESRDYESEQLAAIAGIGVAGVATEFLGPGGHTVATGAPPDHWGMFEVNLSAAALKFISDLHYGRIDPRAVGFDLGVPRPDDLDLGAVIRALAATPHLEQALATLEPQFLHYRLLEKALIRYQTLAVQQPTAANRLRVRQIDLTLERWRWLPAFETPPIIVNIPEFRLFAFRTTADRAADILQMDVIVGRTFPRNRTPVFVADLKSVIFRPHWDVPRSITVQEMLPKIRAKPSFLAEQHLEIIEGASDTAVALPPTPENLAALASGAARLRQRPGPDNSLGLIKFDLPNRYDVYLHSTPAQQLFRSSPRAFSHGCIRVSDPVALAGYVLRETPGDWTPERIRAAMNGSETRRVRLARPIRVMVLYGTVLAKEDGEVLFFSDLYGQDRRLEQLLGLKPIVVGRGPALGAGSATFERGGAAPYLPSGAAGRAEYSERTGEVIDREVQRLLLASQERVSKTLRGRRIELAALAQALLKAESVERPTLLAILETARTANAAEEATPDATAQPAKSAEPAKGCAARETTVAVEERRPAAA